MRAASSVTADLTVIATTLADARANADRQFEEFFGHDSFEVRQESASANSVDVSSRSKPQSVIAYWQCDFHAEAAA